MPILATTYIDVNQCSNGIYLRWYHSQGGWHYWIVETRVEGELKTTNKDIQTTTNYSRISKVQKLTGKDFKVNYNCGAVNLTAAQKDALVGMLEAESVQWFRNGYWQDIEIERKTFAVKPAKSPLFNIEFSFEFLNYLEDVE